MILRFQQIFEFPGNPRFDPSDRVPSAVVWNSEYMRSAVLQCARNVSESFVWTKNMLEHILRRNQVKGLVSKRLVFQIFASMPVPKLTPRNVFKVLRT